MADTPNHPIHGFKIVPLTDIHAYIGVNYTKIAVQTVHAYAAVQRWRFNKVDDNKYLLGIGNYHHTYEDEGKVTVSAGEGHGEKWEIKYHESQDAYTITLAKDPSVGWTAPIPTDDYNFIKVATIVATSSEPPRYIPRQLFRLIRDD